MHRARLSPLLLAALVILGEGRLLSGQASGTGLIDGINKRDEARAARLLKQGADPNAPDAVTQPAITAAAYHADVNLPDLGGNSPLLHAAMRGRTDAVRLLLDSGANVNTGSKHGWTPLMAPHGRATPASSPTC